MYGAIIGDLAGSIYEYDEFKDSLNKIVNLKRRMERLHSKSLIPDDAFYSDDTILTIAILDAIISNSSYESKLREYGKKYKDKVPFSNNYFKYMFSPGFVKWCNGNYQGISNGNGAAMRISPVGYMFNSKEEVVNESRNATIPSHNSESAIKAAESVSLVIYMARNNISKDKIYDEVKNISGYDLNYDIDLLRRTNSFNGTCDVTVPQAIYCALSSNTFEESIRKSISIGGDTNTIACITGSMAEALYGIDNKLIELSNEFIPEEFKHKLMLGYNRK